MSALHDLATNPQHTKWLYPLLLIADAALCGLVIEYVPCTLRLPPSFRAQNK